MYFISLWMIKSRHHLLDAPKVPDGDITAAVYCRVRTLITGRSVGTGGIKQLDILLDRYFLLIRKRRHRSGMVPVDSFILEMKRLNRLAVFLLNVFGVPLPNKLTGASVTNDIRNTTRSLSFFASANERKPSTSQPIPTNNSFF